ncbi:MAG: hypothetical protein GY851_22180 [bacterium]|nr:hypothetical protein [bacterium]
MNGPVGRRTRSVRRVAGLAVLVLAGGAAIVYLFGDGGSGISGEPAFSGEMRIRQGDPQRLAFRVVKPAPGSVASDAQQGPIYRSVPGENIVATYPNLSRNWLDARLSYDVAHLPFEISLESQTVLRESVPRDTIRVGGPGGGYEKQIRAGQQVTLGDTSVTVSAIRTWSGLLEYPDGAPMTELSVRVGDGDWLEHVFVASGNWLLLDEGVAIRFVRHADEDAEVPSADVVLPGDESAQWGLVQSDEVHWLKSLLPGTGVETEQGVTAVLLEYDPARMDEEGREAAAIRVAIRDGEAVSRQWYFANADSEEGPIRFLHPARFPWVFLVHAMDDAAATVTAFRDGAKTGQKRLELGEMWRLDVGFVAVRMDGVSSAALPVSADSSTTFEAVLEDSGRRWRVREGASTWLGENVVEFEREADPPEVAYDLAIHDPARGEPVRFRLGPGEAFEYGAWTFLQSVPNWRDPATATLTVEHR